MRKRTLTSRVAALSLFAIVGLVAALAIAWPNLARAHSPGGASLTALAVTVTSDGTALTLMPTFDSAVHYYTIPVDNSVAQVTVLATPEDDGTVAYKNETGTTLTDADASADGMQVNIPTAGRRINVEVTHTDSGTTTTQTYGVLVIRDGPAVHDLLLLMELYNSAGGANWKNTPNWGSTKPFEEWDALTTSGGNNERIRHLALDDQNLVGTIPASLGNLDEMAYLDLSFNKLTGPIPDLIKMTILRDLALHENQLSGPIPASLGTLIDLEILWLANNALTGPIPEELGNLIELKQLELYGNDLTGPIPDLSKLTDLDSLRLAGNQLTGPITGLSSLTKLRYLTLPNNQLSGEITSLSSLTKLVELKLFSNQFTGEIPDSLSRLTSLKWLSLAGNQFTGEIPEELGSHRILRHLFLDRNQLDGTIPEELGSIRDLKTLNLGDNQLTGTIPEELGNLRKLDFLYLDNNQLSGPIPAELGSISRLRVTRFAGNALTGCVPNGLRYLMNAPDVTMLDPEATDEEMLTLVAQDFVALGLPFCTLSSLTLSGVTLQQAFASDTVVYTASVTHEVESTTVTATLHNSNDPISIMKGAATYMNSDSVPLDVGQNVITIAISPPNGTPTHTYTVTIFRAEGDQAALMALYNSAGGASWTDKTNWGSTTEPLNTWFGVKVDGNGNVTELALPGNNLSGPLPAALGSLTSLTTLDLSDNQLSGTIPDLTTLTQLQTLDLSDNQLSGTIPDLAALTQLQTLNLSANQLSRPIPDLAALTQLQTLNLSANQLSRPIPDLSTLTQLQTLNLSDNRLTGTIPDLTALTQVHTLNLGDNRLTGPIPAELGSLTSLRQLYLNKNQLSGCAPDGLRTRLTNHDFIAVDANSDGDTTDTGDTPGLPFCTLSSLTFSGDVTLNPVFTSSTTTYTATAAHDVQITTVTALLNNSSNTVSITKGVDTYTSGDQVPLDVGSDVITLEVTRADDPLTTHTYTVTVTRQPNTQPTFNDGPTTTRGVDENTFAGRDIGDPVRATDTENDTLTYSLDATSAASFDIDEFSGQLLTKADLDHETKSSYTVTVSVRDSKDGNGDDDEVTDDTIRVTILVADLNEVPEFPQSETGMRSVNENTVSGVNIGAPVAATDDDDDNLTYSLDDSIDADSFSIDASSGQLRTRAALDYETGPNSYTVDVTAADPSGANDRITVTITVNNVDEEGTVTLSTTQPIEGTLLDATLDDPDEVSGSVTWSWRRSQNRTSSGTLISGATAATYTPVAADVTRFLRATASYTDGEGSGKSAQAVSTNKVLPVPVAPNEPPVFDEGPSTSRNVDENTVAGEDIGPPVTATDDDDDDTLTYSLDLTSRATFDIVATRGQLRTSAALNFEGKSSYTVTVTATDPSGADDTITVTITVGNVDEDGTVTLGSTQPIVGTPLTATLDDPDNVSGSVTWSWESSPNGNSWTPISGATSAAYTPVAADVGDYLQATASYTDGEESGKSAQAVSTNSVLPVPVAPNTQPAFVESSPATRNVAENTSPGEDIGEPVAATDPEDDTLTYSLDVPSRATFDIVATTGQLQTKAALDYETGTSTYTVTVDATDPAGLYGTIEVTITVNNVDEPGTVTLSSLQPQVGFQLTATLDDPDNVSGSEPWSWERSPNRNSSWTLISGETSATYTPVADDVGDYLRATASYDDGEGSGKSAEGVSANVVQAAPAPQNEPPEFPSTETRARDVDENTPADTNIGLPVTATDPNDDTLTYSLDLPSRASFNMVATTGRLQTKAALDYEDKSSYTVTVTATDPAGETDTVTVTITVNNVDEPGTVTLSSLQPIEGTPLTATLDDPDEVSGSVTWSWAYSQNGTSSWTLISGETSATYSPDAVTEGRFLQATASYTDGEGSGKSAQAVSTNRVLPAPVAPNTQPAFVESSPATRNVAENTSPGENIGEPVAATDLEDDTLTYSLDTAGAASFDIDATTGQLRTKADLDHEATATYSVTVTATDTAGATGTITVTITVTNLDEAGTVTLSSLQPQVRFQLTATLDDPDDVVSGSVTWLWAGSPSGGSSSWSPISGATSATYTPVTADETRYLRATASYTDGEDSDKSAQVVSANTVQPAPVAPNDPPIFVESPSTSRNVDENTSPGEDIGEPVTATDPEDNTLTYSLDADGAASFDINKDTGQLRTKADLDFETTDNYSVTVTATDTAGATGSIRVTIDVNNLDEPGTVTLSSPQPLVAIRFTATLDDPDNVSGRETWSWARSQSGASDWTSISGETSATYTPVLDDVGDYLRATASYTDGEGSGKSAQAVSANAVEVAPGRNKPVLREHPTATRSVARTTPAGRNIGAPFSATDADNDALTYSLGGPDATEFDLNRSSGQLLTRAPLTGINRTSYEVEVSVSDSKDDEGNLETDPQSDTTTKVTINVTTRSTSSGSSGGSSGGFGPAPVAPKFSDGFRTTRPLALTARVGDAVGDPVAATHPNDDAVTYSLSGADATSFTVDEETGQIRVKEGVVLILGTTYTVNLTATDSAGFGAIIIVVIEVVEGVADPYDLNRDGIIDKVEVVAAIADYFAGLIEKDEILELISRYFAA